MDPLKRFKHHVFPYIVYATLFSEYVLEATLFADPRLISPHLVNLPLAGLLSLTIEHYFLVHHYKRLARKGHLCTPHKCECI